MGGGSGKVKERAEKAEDARRRLGKKGKKPELVVIVPASGGKVG